MVDETTLGMAGPGGNLRPRDARGGEADQAVLTHDLLQLLEDGLLGRQILGRLGESLYCMVESEEALKAVVEMGKKKKDLCQKIMDYSESNPDTYIFCSCPVGYKLLL